MSPIIHAILPEGSVRDEGAFLMLVVLLAAFVGAVLYLRLKRTRDQKTR